MFSFKNKQKYYSFSLKINTNRYRSFKTGQRVIFSNNFRSSVDFNVHVNISNFIKLNVLTIIISVSNNRLIKFHRVKKYH